MIEIVSPCFQCGKESTLDDVHVWPSGLTTCLGDCTRDRYRYYMPKP